MPHVPAGAIPRLAAMEPEPAMTRASYFNPMSFARLARLLNEKELYHGRHQHCSESFLRCCSFLQFCCCSLCSLVTIVTPWMLSAAELIIMMILYFTVVPDSVDALTESSALTDDHFTMRKDLKDVLILSVIRVILLSISYALVSSKCSYCPYYYITWLTSLILIPYAIVRSSVSDLRPLGAALSLMLTLISFSIVHVIVAHTTVKRLQRRANMGLGQYRSFWKEDDWIWSGSAESTNTNDAIAELLAVDDEDIPRERLADQDSTFIDCRGLSVHYKEERPDYTTREMDPSFAILLIHGYGGGVFSWRHLMKPLAENCDCRVVAFDRPAFGLTERPRFYNPNANPYSLHAQQELILEFCKILGIKKVLLVGHSDGCLLALMLGAALNPFNSQIPHKISSHTRKLLKSGSVRQSKRPVMIDMSICRAASADYFDLKPTTVQEGEDANQKMEDTLISRMHSQSLTILAMAFLHPDLSCDDGLSFTHLLRQSKIARKVLRPLLRSDIGEVSNRRAWYDSSKLTREILELYKAPLRIRGWDSALVAYTKERRSLTNDDIKKLTQKVIGMPLMVLTGEKDRIVPPDKASALIEQLHTEHKFLLPNCGHLSHEEVPEMLRDTIVDFVQHMYELYEDM